MTGRTRSEARSWRISFEEIPDAAAEEITWAKVPRSWS
jgi:hypothetical protein